MLVVAAVNQKGGVGKTTVVINLAAAAAKRGLDVVVVDLDPQANATSGLGVWDPPRTVDEALAADRAGSAAELVMDSGWDPAVMGRVPRLIASSPQLAVREPQLATDPLGAQDRLARALEGLDADLVLIDCPPSLGLLTVNGLFAADRVLVVTEPGAWAVDGVDQIVRNVERVAERRGGRPELAGILVNRLARTRDARYWDEQLRAAHGGRVLGPVVRMRAAVAEAAAQSTPLYALARDGIDEAIAEFDEVLDELIGRREPVVVGATGAEASVPAQPNGWSHWSSSPGADRGL